MKTQLEETQNATKTFVKMSVDAWQAQNQKVDKLLDEISDEQLKAEIAPGKNSGVYLLGHLTAVNDGLFQILGLGKKLYPQLEEIFLTNPENKEAESYSISDLKKYWNEINAKLSEHFSKLSADEWFEKHTSVSVEDFAKEPHRNRLNVLVSRTIHQSYHLAQLNFLKTK